MRQNLLAISPPINHTAIIVPDRIETELLRIKHYIDGKALFGPKFWPVNARCATRRDILIEFEQYANRFSATSRRLIRL
jgi:hypothetical protein